MGIFRYCKYYTSKNRKCRNCKICRTRPINAKLKLVAATKSQKYQLRSDNLTIIRRCWRQSIERRNANVFRFKDRNNWQMMAEYKRNIDKSDFSYIARVEMQEDEEEKEEEKNGYWKQCEGTYYEIEDQIIEKLDNEKCIENGKS